MQLVLRTKGSDNQCFSVPAMLNGLHNFRFAIANVRIDRRDQKIVVFFSDVAVGLLYGDWRWGGSSPSMRLDLPQEELLEVYLQHEGTEAAQLTRFVASRLGVSADVATQHFYGHVPR